METEVAVISDEGRQEEESVASKLLSSGWDGLNDPLLQSDWLFLIELERFIFLGTHLDGTTEAISCSLDKRCNLSQVEFHKEISVLQ